MGKHLPPPKNKHLSPNPSKHRAARAGSRERDLLSERHFSMKPAAACIASAALLAALRYVKPQGWLGIVLYLLPLAISGAGVVYRLILKLLSGDFYEEDIIIILACTASFCIGHYTMATVVMLLYRLGEILMNYSVSICRDRLDEVLDLGVRKANVLKNGAVHSLKPEKVKPGDIIIVSPGEIVPLDGIVVEGMSSVDSSMVSGDKKYINVSQGSTVLSGFKNLSRDIKIKVIRNYDDSVYTVAMDNLMDKGRRKAKEELFVSRFARIYTPAAVILAVILAVVPPLFSGFWNDWIEVGIIFLILSCPCALTVSVPLTYMSALIKTTSQGINVKNAHVMDKLSRAETVVFDKTGTVTDGNYFIAGIYPDGVEEDALIKAAAEAERYSKHPVAKAIRQLCKLRELSEDDQIEVEEIHGQGIQTVVNNHQIFVGNASLLEQNGIRYNVPHRAGAAIHVAVDGIYWGYILVSDRLKNGAFDAIEGMRRQGVRTMVLLTGDVRSVSRTLASSLNFDMVKAELMPESKVAAVEYLMATKGERSSLAFVGDAENDREALSRADVGIALGALTAPEPFDSADVVIMSENLSKLPELMSVARLSYRIAVLNILTVLGIKFLLLLMSLFGIIPIILAAALDTAALIFCMLNTLRLLKREKEEDIQ